MIVTAVAALSIAAFGAFNTREAGASQGSCTIVVRTADGQDQRFPQPADIPSEITVRGRCGPMVVERGQNGLVRVASSVCPGQNCVRMGWVRPAEGIVCIPNGVLIHDPTPGPAVPDGVAR